MGYAKGQCIVGKLLFYFRAILTPKEKKRFLVFLVILFLGSISSIFGIGAVIPFVNILIQPDKLTAYPMLSGFSYYQLVLFFAGLLIFAFWLKNGIAALLVIYQSKYLCAVIQNVQTRLFKGYMAMSYEAHVNRSTPALIRNINVETPQFSGGIVQPMGVICSETFATVFVVGLLLYLNFIFSFFVIVLVLLSIFIFMRLMQKKASLYGEQRASSWCNITNIVLCGLAGIKEAKLYHKERVFVDDFDDKTHLLKHSSMFNMVYQQSPRMLVESVAITVVMAILVVFIWQDYSSQELFVLLSVFGVSAAQLLPGLNRITQALSQIKYSYPALVTVYNEINKVECNQNRVLENMMRDIKPIDFVKNIKVKNLCYQYQDGTVALTGVNINLPKNKRIAFVGASGAGKTTLVDLLMGLYLPTKGEIMIDGKALKTEADIFSFQRLFAYIPQSIVLYDQSIQENIAFGVPKEAIDHQKITQCLQAAQLDTFVQGLNQQENTLIGESGVRLSGGQRQRIGIARALYQNPQILVMDEATSALDNQTEKEVTNVLSTLKDLTIITIAHRLTTIQHYDIIYMLDQGKVIASGNYNELLENCDPFKQMVLAVN